MVAFVFQYSLDNKTENFDDLPARFGYRLPSEGLKVSKLYDIDERLYKKKIYNYIYLTLTDRSIQTLMICHYFALACFFGFIYIYIYMKSSFPKRDKRQILKMSSSCHFAVY